MALEGDSRNAVMNGGSLLLLAVAGGHASLARLLVKYGADPNRRDNLGVSPLGLANERGDKLLLSVLAPR